MRDYTSTKGRSSKICTRVPPGDLWSELSPAFSRGSDVSKTILIADDNKLLLATLRQVLECQPGFVACGETVNGKDAIEKAQRLKPDLIVLDISMPVMNGLDAAHTLRQMMPDLPILLFTIHKTRLSAAEALASRASGVAFKGDGIRGLVSQVKTLLRS
jgi:two-component system nitrate/nitrite response regulator NarL